MKCRVTTEGGFKNYGVEREITGLDDTTLLAHEMNFASADEIARLVQDEDVESIEFTKEALSGYDAHLTVTCKEYL